MRNIEAQISPLIENQFPSFYKDEGPNFISFVEAYYEWLETMLQHLTLTDPELFEVGDRISQTLDNGVLVKGQIVSRDGDVFIVQPDTLEAFRCIELCGVIHPITKDSDGTETYIIRTVNSSPIYQSRNLLSYRDVDQTVDRFVLLFKEKYLKNIQFDIATNKKLLIKNSLDLYRSKGTARSFDLFFKLVYGIDSDVYYPGDDILRPSSGVWHKPKYLEISNSIRAVDFVGRQIEGVNSGATAFVEKYIKRRVGSRYQGILFISNIAGDFEEGELLKTDTLYQDAPHVTGSLNYLTVTDGGSNFSVGDIVELSGSGIDGKARVANVSTSIGSVSIELEDGGFGYTVNSLPIVSDFVLTLEELEPTDVVSSINIIDGSTGYSNGDWVYIESNQSVAEAVVHTNAAGTLTAFTLDYAGYGFDNANNVSISFANSTGGSSDGSGANITITTAKNSTYFNFGETVEQNLGNIVFSSANNDFELDDRLFSYNGNNEVIAEAAIIGVEQDGTDGTMRVNFYYGEFSNTETIFSSANTKSFDIDSISLETNSAKIIPTRRFSTMTIELDSTSFTGTTEVYQLDNSNSVEVANASVSAVYESGIIEVLEVNDINGSFNIDNPVRARGSNLTATITEFVTKCGIYDVVGTFVNNTFIVSSKNHTVAQISNISVGSGASFELGDLENVEEFLVNSDLLSANNVEWLAANSDPMTPEPYMDLPLNNYAFGFPESPQGNLSSVISSCLSFDTIEIGTIQNIQGISPGSQYNDVPDVLVYEPLVVPYEYQDYIIEFEDSTGTFFVNETVSTNTTSGIVKELLSNTSIHVKRLSIANEFAVGSILTGPLSGTSANITSVQAYDGEYVGQNAEFDVGVRVTPGAVTTLEVIDSGFGYSNGMIVSFANESSTGTATVQTAGGGESLGFYRENKGFLSSNKYIHDGDYYQEYSYDIISKLPLDRYAEMFKDVMHVAGTKLFGSVLLSSEPDSGDKVFNSSVTITDVDDMEGFEVRTTTDGEVRFTDDDDRRIGEI